MQKTQADNSTRTNLTGQHKAFPGTGTSPSGGDPWWHAICAVSTYLKKPQAFDTILERALEGLDPTEHRRASWLAWGVLREFTAIDADLAKLISAVPKPATRALLMVGAFELNSRSPEERPPVVHFAVEVAKRRLRRGDIGLVNAVLRKLATKFPEDPARRAERVHPRWLLERWQETFGPKATGKLLKWNQEPPPVYLHVADDPPTPEAVGEATAWNGFRAVAGEADWRQAGRLLADGRGYIQDPLARHPGDLLADRIASGSTLLDLCAAPGGKSWDVLRRCGDRIRQSVLVDLPGVRFALMEQNIATWKHPGITGLAADVATLEADALQKADLPPLYDIVLLDAPCSNTGVLRRRPDAKIRLAKSGPSALTAAVALQARLLDRAARFTRPGGLLLYSTCSIEPEENLQQIKAFLQRHPTAQLLDAKESFPWTDQHDGGGAFLLTVGTLEK